MKDEHPEPPAIDTGRRLLLRLGGLTAGGAALGALTGPLAGPVRGLCLAPRKRLFSQTRLLMGTLVTVAVMDASGTLADEAIERCFYEMAPKAWQCDRHQSNSPLSGLNTEGRLFGAPRFLMDQLQASRRYHRITGGAYDPTVGPVIELFGKCRKTGRHPFPGEMRRVRDLISAADLRLGTDWARLGRPGMKVTLDGMAKGAVVDAGVRVLRRLGVQNALINAGGDVGLLGDRGGRPWRIGIRNPFKPSGMGRVLRLGGGAVSTSGEYEVYFDRERLLTHLIDPDTGLSPRHYTSVTVRAGSCKAADALSTALFVMPPSRARRIVKHWPGIGVWYIGPDGREM